MIREIDRKLTMLLVRLRIWRVKVGLFRVVEVHAPRGTRWMLHAMKHRQRVDDLHHAPCCPANHWHRQRLVFQRCSCGAAREVRHA